MGRPRKRKSGNQTFTASEKKRKQRSREDFKVREQARNTEARRNARQDKNRRREEQLINTESRRLARQDENRRREEQQIDTESRRLARQDENRRREEQQINTESRRLARQDENSRREEQQINTESRRLARQDENRRREEQQINTESRRLARQDENSRREEQQMNTESRRLARQDENRRREEQQINTESRRLARQDENRRREEQQINTESRRLARQDENSRREEQQINTESRRLARQDESRRREEQKINTESRRIARQDENRRREEQQINTESRRLARQDENSRREEQQINTESRRLARQDENSRREEQQINTESRRLARQDESRRREEQQINTESRRIARQDENRRREEQQRNTDLLRLRRLQQQHRGPLYLVALDQILNEGESTHYIGKFTSTCPHCDALHFKKEAVANSYKFCCHHGKVSLQAPRAHATLKNLIECNDTLTKKYLDQIRKLNSSLAFASMTANLDEPTGRGPFCFRIHGQIHHYFGCLHPAGSQRSYASLYFLDNEEAIRERLRRPENKKIDEFLLNQLADVIISVNPFAHSFKLMKEVENEERAKAEREGRVLRPVSMIFSTNLPQDLRRYNEPKTSGIAVVFVGNDGEPPSERTFVVHSRDQGLKMLSSTDPFRDPMVYPLLFPYGEFGWHVGLQHREEHKTPKRQQITPLQFYAHRIAIRKEFSLLHSSGKLFQQYIVDCYITVEGLRLKYIKENQTQLRVEKYQGLMDYINNQAEERGVKPGRMVILPSTFIGSPRNMQQRFQDAMAIVGKFGKPDLFITFTSNPKWQEIRENLKPWETTENRPDIVARVFHLKLKQLLDDLVNGHIFGKVKAFVYVVEFQKRGLPHCHILIILDTDNKPRDQEIIDKIVSAEIPDLRINPRLQEIIQSSMIHGPCGNFNTFSPCMENGKCSKRYPKDFVDTSLTNVNGYPLYRRRNDGKKLHIKIRGECIEIDNRWIVPYNPYLSLKYNAHINVEVCSTVKAVKYLFKYVYKGYDCARIKITQHNQDLRWDEINTFLDSRYVGAPEAAWRLFEFEMYSQSHTIFRLAVHLPMEQNIYFAPGEEAEAFHGATERETTLTGWFQLNKRDEVARNIFYVDLPNHYVWQQSNKIWKPREKGAGKIIGRLYFVSPSQQELYYLRLLLLHVNGAQSYEDLKTVNGILYSTFKEAAREMNLLEDDTEWERCLEECTHLQMPSQMRHVFSLICIFCNPNNPGLLWNQFKTNMIEDYKLKYNDHESENRGLMDIEALMKQHGFKCVDFGLPSPDRNYEQERDADEVNSAEQLLIAEEIYQSLNEEQRSVVDKIIHAVNGHSSDKIYFVDGPGGTGKTYLYKYIIYKIMGQNKIVLPVAWTGIAANLLPGGRTAHSAFKFPVPLLETSVSAIKPNSKLAEKLMNASLILWDEASMAQGAALEVLDRLLKDITGSRVLFGNKVVVFGGDFRQVPPVVRHGSRASIAEASIKSWKYWPKVKKMKLTRNMRAGEREKDFSNWLLQLGNGRLENIPQLPRGCIKIPDVCITENDLVTEIFGKILPSGNFKEIEESVILCPRNDSCFEINNTIVEQYLEGESKMYYSVDKIVSDDQFTNIPIEYINSLTPAGLPPHKLVLKIGAIVMLIRNLDLQRNMVNGLRLRVTKLNNNTIEAERLSSFSGSYDRILIPRIDLTPSDPTMPFNIRRRQFPIRIAFAMTINKAQGQTYKKVGLHLPNPVFSHGQLYVAFSRVKRFEDIKVKITPSHCQGKLDNIGWYTKNVVFEEILED